MKKRRSEWKLPYWLRDAVAYAAFNHLEDLRLDGAIDYATQLEMSKLLANAGLPGLLPRCRMNKLTATEQEEAIRKIRTKLSKPAKDYQPSTAVEKETSTMSNGYLGVHMYVKAGAMPPADYVKNILTGFNKTSGYCVAKPGKDGEKTLKRFVSEKSPTHELVMKSLEMNKAYERLYVFGFSSDDEIQKEDLQPFVLVPGEPGPEFVCCLDGVYADVAETPFSKEYAIFQQKILPILSKVYSPTMDDTTYLVTCDEMFRGHSIIDKNKATLTIMSSSGEVLRISADDAPVLQADWGFCSLDLNKKADTVYVPTKDATPAKPSMRARTQDEIDAAVWEGEDEDEAKKVLVPITKPGAEDCPFEEPAVTPPITPKDQALSSTALTLVKQNNAAPGTQMKDAANVASIKWVRCPASIKDSSMQTWYAQACGAKKGKFTALHQAVKDLVVANKRPWVKPNSGWINGVAGRSFIVDSPTCWSTQETIPSMDDGKPADVKVGDKGGTAPNPATDTPTVVPNTPTEGAMQQFSERKVKQTYFDLNGRVFDPEKYKTAQKLRTTFTGPKGLGGGITLEELRCAPEGAWDILIKDYPDHAKALLLELLFSQWSLAQAMSAINARQATQGKAA